MMSVCLPPVFNHFDIESMKLNFYYVLDTKAAQHSILAAFYCNFKFIASWRNARAQDLHHHGFTSPNVNRSTHSLFLCLYMSNNKWKLRSKGVKLAIHETLVVDSQESDWRKYILTTAEKTKKNLDTEKHQTS